MAGPFCLKREAHCTTILSQLFRDDTFTDVILSAEEGNIKAHKSVLSLASSYFQRVLWKEPNTQSVIVFRDIEFRELKNLVEFIYTGEVIVDALGLQSFMNLAQSLEILSLCGPRKTLNDNEEAAEVVKRVADFVTSPLSKTRKLSGNFVPLTRSTSQASTEDTLAEIKIEVKEDFKDEEDVFKQEIQQDLEDIKNERDSSFRSMLEVSSLKTPGPFLSQPETDLGDFPMKETNSRSFLKKMSLPTDSITETHWSAIEEATCSDSLVLSRTDSSFSSNLSDEIPTSPSFTFARGRIYPSPAQDSLKKLILRTEAEVNELYARLDANLASIEDQAELSLKRNTLFNYKKLLRSKINAAKRSMKSREKRKHSRERFLTAMAGSKAC